MIEAESARKETPMRSRLTLTAVATVTLVALGACSSSKPLTSADSSVSSAPTTTIGATTTVATVTTATVPATTTPPTFPTTLAPVVPSLPAGSTVLGAPTNLHADAGTIPLPGDLANCDADPGMPGFHNEECFSNPSFSNGVVVMVQRENGDGHYRVIVFFKKAGSNDYASRYVAEEPGAGTWSSVHAVVGDYNADDGAEVWVGYRAAGSGGYLDLDLLDPRPSGAFFLGGLQGLPKGAIHVRPGGADIATAVYAGADPTCCPSSVLNQQIAHLGEQWYVTAGSTAPAASAPVVASDFP